MYDPTDDQSKDLIKEHYRNHAVESQKQLDLLRAEERPYLPVGHLVQRVRDLAAQKRAAGGGAADGGAADGPGMKLEEETKPPLAPPAAVSQQRADCPTIYGGGLESRLISAPVRKSVGLAGTSHMRQWV